MSLILVCRGKLRFSLLYYTFRTVYNQHFHALNNNNNNKLIHEMFSQIEKNYRHKRINLNIKIPRLCVYVYFDSSFKSDIVN